MLLQYLTKELLRVPIKKTVVATRRRNEFWNLLTFSKKGIVNNPIGTEAIKRTPNNLLVLCGVFEIRERSTIRVIFPKELQMDPPVHQSLMVRELLSLHYMQLYLELLRKKYIKDHWAMRVPHNNYGPSL
ncbi:RNA polymerase alpha subunit [Iris pallida]|uniref:RNA polymerase alpha subunit (Chloroplast) n=1 Tax=Iris pallida TaxID=29817 RepID=A0AAX6E4L1_IRIPA|nr:RNA polymerase alpha subunit [Iris pallida]